MQAKRTVIFLAQFIMPDLNVLVSRIGEHGDGVVWGCEGGNHCGRNKLEEQQTVN